MLEGMSNTEKEKSRAKVTWECWDWGPGLELNRAIRVGLFEKVRCKQLKEEKEPKKYRRKNSLDRGKALQLEHG